jgi:hypothetical protein
MMLDDKHDEPTVASILHHTVSTANELVARFDELLKTPAEAFEVPRDSLELIRKIMSVNAMLAAKLYEENERIMEQAEALLQKTKK